MTNEEMEKAIEKGEMTTELAIQLLSETGFDCMYEEATQEALDMAIQSLKELAIAKEFIRWVDHFTFDVFTDEKYENALTNAIIEGLSTYKYKLEELRGKGNEDDDNSGNK